jgi:hypothetical protein
MKARDELLRDQLDGFGKSLFDAGDLDAPKDGSAEKLLVALGIGTAITAASATAAAATTTAASAAPAAASGGGVIAMATKIAILAVVTTGGAVAVDRMIEKPTPIIVAPATTPSAAAVSAPIAHPTSVAATTPEALPDALPDAPAAMKKPAASAPALTLTEQVELVDAARAELAAGNADGALAATRRFEQKLGAAAALHPEVMLVAVQAHLARGDAASARRVETALRKQHPTSAAARRAAELVGAEK